MWCIVVLLVGCGRIGFDLERTSGDAGGDGTQPTGDVPGFVDAAIPAGLVAWYPMQDTVGGVVADATGHGHDASCAACPTVTSGHGTSSALQFDGTTTFVQVPHASEFDFASGFTIAFWAKVDVIPASGYDSFVMRQVGSANENSFALDVATTGTLEYYSQSGSVYGTTVLSPATWFHVTTTWDGTTKSVFLNGASDGSGAGSSLTFDTDPILFGADNTGTSIDDFLGGAMYDVRFYDRVLTATEIATLAAL